jgi:protein O-GlcNAc transferase
LTPLVGVSSFLAAVNTGKRGQKSTLFDLRLFAKMAALWASETDGFRRGPYRGRFGMANVAGRRTSMTIEESLLAAKERHQAGDLAEAERLCRQVLAGRPDHPEALKLLGIVAISAAHQRRAEPIIAKSISGNPGQAEDRFNLGLALAAQGRAEEAVAAYRRAVALRPDWGQAFNNLGTVLVGLGRLEEAIECFGRALELAGAGTTAPGADCAELFFNLGNALSRMRRMPDGIAAFRQALALRPGFAEAWNNLGLALMHGGQSREAATAYERAIALVPNHAEAHNNLGNALLALGQPEEAVEAFRAAVAMRPGFAAAHNSLGNALLRLRRFEEAIAAYRRARELRPDWPGVQTNMAAALFTNGNLDEAIETYQAALKSWPRHWDASIGLATTLRSAARISAAIECCERAERLEPRLVEVASFRLFTLQFDPGYDAKRILSEHRRFDERYGAPLAQFIKPHENDRTPGRRLRVGYVSPDFREHCQALFMGGLLANHDREQIEVCCYHSVADADAITARLRGYADKWRDVRGMSDESLAELIRSDGIDVMVDLTMHMSGGRLLAYARKPAPVQITWLAYPGTTGLSTMDYRLTDPQLDPPGHDDRYVERSIRLPETFWCYDPWGMEPEGSAVVLPEPGPLPLLRNGFVTFGCLNDFCKLNAGALALWSRVMQADRRSRLRMLAPIGTAREWVLEELGRNGVAADRVDFVTRQPRAKYLAEFQRIDVCMDTSPYNGHTTSLDSYWMGVPVVSLVGRTVVGRAGLSQLSNLKMVELAACDDEQFVQITKELAADSARLAEIRRTLRERMMSSPLTNASRFARGIEAAYRQAWRAWVESSDQKVRR